MGRFNDQIDHILADKWRQSSVLDVRWFMAADCDTDHYLVVANVRERQRVSKKQRTEFIWRGSISGN
jgi:hypothetical protein